MENPQAPKPVQLEFEKIVAEALESSEALYLDGKGASEGRRKKGGSGRAKTRSSGVCALRENHPGRRGRLDAFCAVARVAPWKDRNVGEFDRAWLEASIAGIREAWDLRSALVSAVSSLTDLLDLDMEGQQLWEVEPGDYDSYCNSMMVLALECQGVEDFCSWAWEHASRMLHVYAECRFESDWCILEELREDEDRMFEVELLGETVRTDDAWGGLAVVVYATYLWATVVNAKEEWRGVSSDSRD